MKIAYCNWNHVVGPMPSTVLLFGDEWNPHLSMASHWVWSMNLGFTEYGITSIYGSFEGKMITLINQWILWQMWSESPKGDWWKASTAPVWWLHPIKVWVKGDHYPNRSENWKTALETVLDLFPFCWLYNWPFIGTMWYFKPKKWLLQPGSSNIWNQFLQLKKTLS